MLLKAKLLTNRESRETTCESPDRRKQEWQGWSVMTAAKSRIKSSKTKRSRLIRTLHLADAAAYRLRMELVELRRNQKATSEISSDMRP